MVSGSNSTDVDIPTEGLVSWTVCVFYLDEFVKCSAGPIILDASQIRPSITLTPGPEAREVCQNANLTFMVDPITGQSYEWVSRNEPNVVLSTALTVNLPPGNYSVRTTGAGCPASEDFDVIGISGIVMIHRIDRHDSRVL